MSVRKRTWTRNGVTKEAWVVDYVDRDGDRHIRTFRRKREADDYHATVTVDVGRGTHTADSKSITALEAGEKWIAHCEAEGLEYGTIKQRREHLRLHIAPFIGAEKLSRITAPRIHRFLDQLRDAGRSQAMRRKVLTNLKIILSFAQGRAFVAQNVARDVKLNADNREAKPPMREGHDYPTLAELRLLMDKAKPRWRPLIVAAVFTGLRASELRGLRWGDLDLTAGVMHVRQRIDAWQKAGPPKSKAGSRDIPLAPIVINTLRQWGESCPPSKLDLVFPSRNGTPLRYSNLRSHVWHPLQVECLGQVKYGMHALRHAAASLFIAHLAWTPKRLQHVMGHASIAMTFDLYGHLFANRDDDREAMRKLEAAVLAA